MATATFYFDAHNGITNENTHWGSTSNAWDGNTTTYSTGVGIDPSGNYELIGSGTNATDLGGTITQVRVRYYDYYLSEGSGTAAYGSYTTLSTPSGGWDWTKLANLKAKLNSFCEGIGDGTSSSVVVTTSTDSLLGQPANGFSSPDFDTSYISRVDIEVTYTPSASFTPTPMLFMMAQSGGLM